ncbi:MAG TPA: PA2779 family protein [Burkholderiales bacterium]|nr:PA2779 family protein [Burkholderiales bacterium]
MKSVWARTICRLLVVLMVWTPYQFAQAGMIGTDQVVSAASQADRAALLNFFSRSDVASRLQALGIDSASARDRVATLTDQEVQSLAAQIDSMPAGADSALGAILIIALLAVAVWYFWKRM